MKKLYFEKSNFEELKEKLLGHKFDKKQIFNFLNAYSIYLFRKHKNFRKSIIKKGNINFPDGFTVAFSLSIMNFKNVQRIKGPNFTYNFFRDKELNKNKKHLFVGLDSDSLRNLLSKFPNLKERNCFTHDIPFIKLKKYEDSILVEKINEIKPDYIWVGLGNPKQEILSNDIFEKINTGIIFNVGAAFDYIKDKKRKAPKFFEKTGLEWFYRMITDFKHTSPKVTKSFIGQFYLPFIIRLRK